jgi:GT2 family glycosyltransferase
LVSKIINPLIDGVVGVYSSQTVPSNFVSSYKNNWIRFSYLKSNSNIDWVFGAIVSIKRKAFVESSGFDPNIPMKFGGEDLEYGKRLVARGYNIVIEPKFEGEHIKHHSFKTFVMNEFERSCGFTCLALKLGETIHSFKRGFVNIYPLFIISTILSWILVILFISGFLNSNIWFAIPVFLLVYISINFAFIKFFSKEKGLIKGMMVIGLIFIDHLSCFIGALTGFLKWMMSK